jgi:hypothetical protein
MTSDFHLFKALKENIVGDKSKDHSEVQTVVTRWLIDTGMD